MGSWLLVIGARKGSLGEAIADYVRDQQFLGPVVTAGISGEDELLDLSHPMAKTEDFICGVDPKHIVCTVGVNLPARITDTDYLHRLGQSMLINVQWPMRLLESWIRVNDPSTTYQKGGFNHFVAISSNSAHIARSSSGPYCASKAALSMAIRCAARELAESQFCAYAYEPGMLDGTPMTENTRLAFPRGPLHRMPGYAPRAGLSTRTLARLVVGNLNTGKELNGCTLRMDAGEQ
jgi:NAD(P)-dependent dehydrogenase (short-subunit alcohol dehydrogenase family)